VRKHLGLIPPAPVQAAMIAALGDDEHVAVQRERYRARRALMLRALEGAGFRIDESSAGLYLWATRGEDAWATVDALAGRGILVTPGSFYGPTGAQHVRVALTATDADVAEAARRLEQVSKH
jgi:aspartate/methionine/tyrosine aminotransferase